MPRRRSGTAPEQEVPIPRPVYGPPTLPIRGRRTVDVSFAGCLAIILSIFAFFVLAVALFTVLLNIVLFNIFAVIDAPLDLYQGAAVYILLAIVGGFFQRVTR